MSKRWKVNAGTQVDVGGKIHRDGEEFTATDAELDEHGSRPYVSEVQSKTEHKAQAAPESKDSKKS